ncbi:hypothetical protein Tco_0221896 [Tanacetum coccineum]
MVMPRNIIKPNKEVVPSCMMKFDKSLKKGESCMTDITNVDQLSCSILQLQHETTMQFEVRLMHERNPDPLALVASHQLTQPAYQSHPHTTLTTVSTSTSRFTISAFTYQSTVHHNSYSQQPSIPQLEYAPTTYQQQQPEFSQPDSSLVVPVFQKGDDPIDAINHMMSFLTAVVTSRYPTTNNQLRTSSNPRQQATIYDGKVTVATSAGRQNYLCRLENTRKFTPERKW